MAARADADVVASHLLQCRPQADAEVSGLLVQAAATAARRGAPHTAAAYLERALHEHAPGDDRGRMLAQLATVAFDAGPAGLAAAACSRRCPRCATARAASTCSRAWPRSTSSAPATPITPSCSSASWRVETDPDARLAVEAASLDALMMIPARHARARAARGGDRPHGDAPIRCSSACSSPTARGSGSSSARPTRPRARRWRCEALEGDLLLREAGRRAAYHLCVRTLVMTDRRRGGAAGDRGHARRGRRARLAAPARRGGLVRVQPRAAQRAGRRGREPRPPGAGPRRRRRQHVHRRRGHAAALRARRARRVRRGPRAAAPSSGLDGGLRPSTRWEIGLRHARARLWLAEGDYERAHAEALRGGRAARAAGPAQPELDAVALDRGAGARAPRAPRGGRRPGRRRAGPGRALRRAGADRPRAARARRRRGARRRARGAAASARSA